MYIKIIAQDEVSYGKAIDKQNSLKQDPKLLVDPNTGSSDEPSRDSNCIQLKSILTKLIESTCTSATTRKIVLNLRTYSQITEHGYRNLHG